MRSWMRLYLVVFVALGLLPGRAEAEDKARIAVLELQGSLKREELSVLSDKVRAGALDATRGQPYMVMTRESLAVLLKDMGIDCKTIQGGCEVETARNIGAAYVLSGAVTQMDGVWMCLVKVHDTKSGELLATDEVEGKAPVDLARALRPLASRLMQTALGGGTVQAPVPLCGSPDQVLHQYHSPTCGHHRSLHSMLKEQACDKAASRDGLASRTKRLQVEADKFQQQARSAWRARASELEACTKLKRDKRDGCIQSLEQWLQAAQSKTLTLSAGAEQIKTDCGTRTQAFPAASRTVSADDVGTAQTLLARLKAADVAPPPPPDSMIVGRLGPRPVALSNASSSERATLDKEWKGCRDGNWGLCSDLGFTYDRGQGVTKSFTRAAELYRLACDKGEMYGCMNLGNRYRDGTGVPQSHKNAVVLFRKACDGGDAGGCGNLGVQYERGHGVPKSVSRANELYKKGCDGKRNGRSRSLGSMPCQPMDARYIESGPK